LSKEHKAKIKYFCYSPYSKIKREIITAPPISDAALVEKAKQKDRQAFQQLVQRHEQQVRATVLGMLGPVAEADDVAQEVFIRFFRSLDNFRGDAQLTTYLSRIAINLSLNELKRRQRAQKRFLFWQRSDTSMPDPADEHADPARTDDQQLVRQALQYIEADYRAVIVLRLLEGYSVKETADILDIPMGTVGSRLARGLDKLKEVIVRWKAM
jgi:RNA polymerase sigma-70 factor (ECF subfamily)